MSNLDWVLRQLEGQFFERKSCFDRLKGKLRPAREVARNVVEMLAAIANADGRALSSASRKAARSPVWTILKTA